MKLVKLVFGWLFLAGFTAAGTYYAMDEVDHRVGLARFQLHARLGIGPYQAPVNPPPNPVNPNPVNPNPVNPNPVNPNPVNPNPVNPNPVNPNPVNPNPVNPNPVNPNPVNPNPVNPNPVNPNPVNPNPVNPNPVNPNPVNPNPVNPNPVTPTPRPVTPKPVNPNPVNPTPNPVNPNPVNPNPVIPNPAPRQAPAPSRPADFTDTSIRLTQLRGQATRFRDTISRMNTPYGTARLDGPLSNLNNFLRQAEQALNANDTATANRLMNAADAEVGKLKELLDQ